MPGAHISEENGKHKLVRKTIVVRGATIVRPQPTRVTLREWMRERGLLRKGKDDE